MGLKVSVVIPTYNRAALWRRGLLARSLERQTVEPHEILICDDGSSDETLQLLTDTYRNQPQVRVFTVTAPKTGPGGGAALAENVLFAESTGDVVLHLDDDGFIHDRALEILQALAWPAAYFGPNLFVDPDSLELVDKDFRLGMLQVPDGRAVALSKGLCCGAMYAAPLATIRAVGGHAMEHAGYLGCDNRIGDALRHHVPCWLLNLAEFSFYHLGLTHLMTLKQSGAEIDYTPWRVAVLGSAPDVSTVNGGEAFWRDGLCGMYVRVA